MHEMCTGTMFVPVTIDARCSHGCTMLTHRPNARNKTFDVCYELPTDGATTMYELVTSVPDKTGAYLAAATSALAKNT
jgi:hypothetical protein